MTRDQLITENVSLIGYVIKKEFYIESEEMREELYQEGMFGLINAADKFDKSKNYKFSTLATKSIKRQILKYISYLNREKRKSNVNTLSLDDAVPNTEDLTFLDMLGTVEDDYSRFNCEYILQLVENTKVKDAKYIVMKKAEGYTQKR